MGRVRSLPGNPVDHVTSMSQLKYLVIAIFLCACTDKTLKMEFEAIGSEDAMYKLYDDGSYSVVVNDVTKETGKVRISGDTLFLLKNVDYNITMNHEILFLLDRDSICSLERQIEPAFQRELNPELKIEGSKYSKKACVLISANVP